MIHERMSDRGKEKLNNKCISANEVTHFMYECERVSDGKKILLLYGVIAIGIGTKM